MIDFDPQSRIRDEGQLSDDDMDTLADIVEAEALLRIIEGAASKLGAIADRLGIPDTVTVEPFDLAEWRLALMERESRTAGEVRDWEIGSAASRLLTGALAWNKRIRF